MGLLMDSPGFWHLEQGPGFFVKKISGWTESKKHLLVKGRSWMQIETQLLALWDEILKHLAIEHVVWRCAINTKNWSRGWKCGMPCTKSRHKNFYFLQGHSAPPRNFCRALSEIQERRLERLERLRDETRAPGILLPLCLVSTDGPWVVFSLRFYPESSILLKIMTFFLEILANSGKFLKILENSGNPWKFLNFGVLL